MELLKKTVVITGASSGIGKAMAQSFMDAWSKVIVLGLHEPSLPLEFHKTDVSKEEEIIAAFSKIWGIDVLVNNAGIAKIASVEKMSTEDLEEMLAVNFKGTFWASKYAIPKMNGDGCIVNVSSLAGLKSFEWYGAYCATKSAVISLTKTLAQELADRRIRANCVAPGIVDTPIWDKMYGSKGKEALKEVEAFVPLKRAGRPEEIAKTVIFLCENDYVNGETILVDGGECVT